MEFLLFLVSFTLPFSKCPLLVIIKVGVSPDSWPRGEGMSQEAILAVKGVTVSVLCLGKSVNIKHKI